jgi:hypothetical protein
LEVAAVPDDRRHYQQTTLYQNDDTKVWKLGEFWWKSREVLGVFGLNGIATDIKVDQGVHGDEVLRQGTQVVGR